MFTRSTLPYVGSKRNGWHSLEDSLNEILSLICSSVVWIRDGTKTSSLIAAVSSGFPYRENYPYIQHRHWTTEEKSLMAMVILAGEILQDVGQTMYSARCLEHLPLLDQCTCSRRRLPEKQ